MLDVVTRYAVMIVKYYRGQFLRDAGKGDLAVMQNLPAYTFKVQDQRRSFIRMIPKSIELTGMFSAFVFLQFTVLGLANHAGEGYFSTSQRELVYYALQVFVILGYLLYGLYFRFCSDKRIRSIAAYFVYGVFFASVTLMLTTEKASLFSVIVSMAAALCLGGIGGAVHHRMSRETLTGMNVARCMGVGSASAVVLQYLFQIHREMTLLLSLFMLAAFILLVFLLRRKFPDAVTEEGRQPEKTPQKRIIFSILITAAFLLFTCFYNEYIHHLQIRSGYASYNVYSWPRLVLVPVYLFFALIGDRKNGKYVPVTSLCVMLIALLNVVLTGSPETHWLNMCLFYGAIAAFTSYYLLTFWRLAPGTKHPVLWAPFGRILDSAMVLFSGAIHLSEFPIPVILGLDIAGIAMVILLMAINGDFNLTEADRAEPAVMAETVPAAPEEVPSLLSAEATLKRMQESYQLTSREADVLRELVLTEDKQAIISERLSIQVKTLQDYVTRLYRKTGAATRAGLTDLYHETRTRV